MHQKQRWQDSVMVEERQTKSFKVTSQRKRVMVMLRHCLEEKVLSLSILDMLGCHWLSIWTEMSCRQKKEPACRKGDIKVGSRHHPYTGAGKTSKKRCPLR